MFGEVRDDRNKNRVIVTGRESNWCFHDREGLTTYTDLRGNLRTSRNRGEKMRQDKADTHDGNGGGGGGIKREEGREGVKSTFL